MSITEEHPDVDGTDVSETEVMIAGLPHDPPVPDDMAPLIRNCWYVIAERDGVDRELRQIRVLNEPLVYYRTEAGDAVVLDDRCAHRRYPLSRGTLMGDDIRCGYHGFTYDSSGTCTWGPVVGNDVNFGVRSYPSHEKGPWLWVWMGDPDKADPTDIPIDDDWDTDHYFSTYKFNPGNYLLLIENLLDLTHLHFLHGEEAAALEQVEAELNRLEVPGGTGWTKSVEAEPLLMLAMWCGGNPEQIVSSEYTTRQIGPAFHDSLSVRSALADESDPLPSSLYVVHGVTPADDRNTHQFSLFRTNVPLLAPKEVLVDVIENQVFEDDVITIGLMQENLDRERRTGRVEFSTRNDRFGMVMRRKLREMKVAEEA